MSGDSSIIEAPGAQRAPSPTQNSVQIVQTAPQNTPPVKRPRGRPPGKMNEATRLMAREKAQFNISASKLAKRLLRAQAIIALGTHHLIELIRDPKDPRIIWERRIVRDEKRQQKFIEEMEYGQDYVIVEGTPGDFRAADAILNRAWGKPKETLEMDIDAKFSLVGLAASRTMIDGNKDVVVLDETPMLAPGVTE